MIYSEVQTESKDPRNEVKISLHAPCFYLTVIRIRTVVVHTVPCMKLALKKKSEIRPNIRSL